MNMSKSIRALTRTAIVAFAAAGLVGVAAVPAQAATLAPATASVVTSAPVGDGEWSPSHEESTRVIPLCKGPIAVLNWLNVNFSDHGRDAQVYVQQNFSTLTRLATGTLDPISATLLLGKAIAQIPSYAITDALFHLPATALDIATGCGILSHLGSNPFSVLK